MEKSESSTIDYIEDISAIAQTMSSMSSFPSSLRTFLKEVLPPFVQRWGRRMFGFKWFAGTFTSWREAQATASGYDGRIILDRVLAATLEVQAGRAAYERDSVLFLEPNHEYALLAALWIVSKTTCGRMRVLDFGGALGSTYWRHASLFSGLAEFNWDVVEQPQFVLAGQKHFASTPLRFFGSIEEAEGASNHDLLLASTVLQYLPNPDAICKEWISYNFPFILFNNLPLNNTDWDRITVQRVPPQIYPASYPVWFLSRALFLKRMVVQYELIFEFPSEAVWLLDGKNFQSTGMLFRRISR